MYLLIGLLMPVLLLCCPGETVTLSDETFLRYPVMRSGSGEAGSFSTDFTAQPPQPVTLSYDAVQDDIEISTTISSFLSDQPDAPDTIRLEFTDAGRYVYQSGAEDEPGTVAVWLMFNGDVIQGGERITYVLGSSRETFMLVPLDAPDPRALDVVRCGDGAQIRLQIGAPAVTNMASGDIRLFESVDSESSIRANVVTVGVIAGPLCVGDVAWWQVQLPDDPASVAWTPETNNRGTYLLSPHVLDDTEADVTCGISRLSPGAFVTGAEVLYTDPDPSSDTIPTRSGDAIYRVTAASTCVNGQIWWQIADADVSGWAMEAQDDTGGITPAPRVEFSDRLQELTAQG